VISSATTSDRTFFFERGDPHLVLRPGEGMEHWCPRFELALTEGVLDVDEIPEDLQEFVLRYLDATMWSNGSFEFLGGHFPEEFLNPGSEVEKVRYPLASFLLCVVGLEWNPEELERAELRRSIFRFGNPFDRARATRKLGQAETLKLFDGQRTVEEIAAASELEEAGVWELLQQLTQAGWVVRCDRE
jgi:hypothetical protein